MILWSKYKGVDLSGVMVSDVVKTLKALRRVISSSKGVHDCGIAGPNAPYKICWVCTMPGKSSNTWMAAEDCLTLAVGADDPYVFEVWPSRNGKALTLKAIDSALVLVTL